MDIRNSVAERPSWDDIFMDMAALVAQRSTCTRKQTAALLVRDNRIISMGYNGTPSGTPHCCERAPPDPADHHEWSAANELHGEMNAILYAARIGVSPVGADLYTLLSPCINCAKTIYTVGIRRVIFRELYTRDLRGLDFLDRHRVTVEHKLSL